MQKDTTETPCGEVRQTTAYREVKIGKMLYRVTSVFKGEVDLKTALEDLAVRRVARDSLSSAEKAETSC